jgi:hypothetical protein
MMMNHRTLVGREFAERSRKFSPKGGFVGIGSSGKRGNDFFPKLLVVPGARAATAHQVNGRIVRQPNQEGALIASGPQQLGLARKFDKHVLQHVAGVILVAGEIQQECEQRLRVFVVQPFDSSRHRFSKMTHQTGRFV